METLVNTETDVPTTTTKLIADKFGKEHRQILDAVRRIQRDVPDFGRANICASSYTSEQNKKLKCFELTKDGYMMVAMGLTGKKATLWKVKFLNAFNQAISSTLTVDARMSKLTKEQAKIKEAGSSWSKMGHEINKAKKKNKLLCDELVNDVQGNLFGDSESGDQPLKTIITDVKKLEIGK